MTYHTVCGVLGKVIERGKDIGRGMNHAEVDYINENGEYDLVGLFTDFRRSYPTLFVVVVD